MSKENVSNETEKIAFFKFEKENDSVSGSITSVVNSNYGYCLVLDSKHAVSITEGLLKILKNMRKDGLDLGMKNNIKITFLGSIKTKQGTDFKNFDVDWKGEGLLLQHYNTNDFERVQYNMFSDMLDKMD
jgi:hypothetical protein